MAGGSTIDTFVVDFERLSGSLAGPGAAWLGELRREALGEFQISGLPGVKDEDWKYTNIHPALRDRLEPLLPGDALASDDEARVLFGLAAGVTAESPLLVFVDGSFRASLSRPDALASKKLRLSSLRERLDSDASALEPWLGKYIPRSSQGFAALNTAFLDDGAVIEIGEGAIVDAPIHVVHLSTRRERPYVTHPRSIVVAGAGSSALVVEHYIGEAGARYLTNTATEIAVGRGAVLGHIRVQDEAKTASHVARVQIEQAEGSTVVSHAFGFGAAISRSEINAKLDGERAEIRLAGLYAVDGSRHVDHHLSIDHAKPHTNSDQLYKGVLDNKARGVFTGRVLVRSGSQKIKAMQKNPSLLLGRGAVAQTRPQLEIYADDVACNHGATIGRLDEDALFYLLSRGIDAREARRILVAGFAAEVVESIVPEALRAALTGLVSRRIGELGKGDEPGESPKDALP